MSGSENQVGGQCGTIAVRKMCAIHAFTPTDQCEVGRQTLDQSTVVRIHVPEPTRLSAEW
jgi:hypothetical protein